VREWKSGEIACEADGIEKRTPKVSGSDRLIQNEDCEFASSGKGKTVSEMAEECERSGVKSIPIGVGEAGVGAKRGGDHCGVKVRKSHGDLIVSTKRPFGGLVK
jgi:hypothetical protein